MRKAILTAAIIGTFGAVSAQETTWKADAAHSRLGFKVRHMGVSEVPGEFTDYEITAVTQGEDWTTAKVTVTIKAASIDTRNNKRDDHLRSCDFLCVEKYPEIRFESTRWEKVGNNKYKLHGKLTLHGTTKDVVLDVEHIGTVKDPWGNTRAGFNVGGVIDRFDFGVSWSNTLDDGTLVVDRNVKLDIHLEMIKQK